MMTGQSGRERDGPITGNRRRGPGPAPFFRFGPSVLFAPVRCSWGDRPACGSAVAVPLSDAGGPGRMSHGLSAGSRSLRRLSARRRRHRQRGILFGVPAAIRAGNVARPLPPSGSRLPRRPALCLRRSCGKWCPAYRRTASKSLGLPLPPVCRWSFRPCRAALAAVGRQAVFPGERPRGPSGTLPAGLPVAPTVSPRCSRQRGQFLPAGRAPAASRRSAMAPPVSPRLLPAPRPTPRDTPSPRGFPLA